MRSSFMPACDKGPAFFGTRVNLVVAVAALDAQRSAQMTNFVHAIGDGIVHSRDEITGHHGKVSADIVGHVHGAAHRSRGM